MHKAELYHHIDHKDHYLISIKFCQVMFIILLLSPLGEGYGLLIERVRLPLYSKMFCTSLFKIGPVFLED